MRTWKGLTALMALAPLAFTSTPASAQEEQPTPAMHQCTAEVLPSQLHSGQKAERVSISLSSPVGNVTEFTTEDAEAGVKVADAADLPKTELAAEEAVQKPIEMAAENNRLTIWLNTEDAQPGTYAFTLKGESGACTGSLVISEKN